MANAQTKVWESFSGWYWWQKPFEICGGTSKCWLEERAVSKGSLSIWLNCNFFSFSNLEHVYVSVTFPRISGSFWNQWPVLVEQLTTYCQEQKLCLCRKILLALFLPFHGYPLPIWYRLCTLGFVGFGQAVVVTRGKGFSLPNNTFLNSAELFVRRYHPQQ